jgi:hypothetical protein
MLITGRRRWRGGGPVRCYEDRNGNADDADLGGYFKSKGVLSSILKGGSRVWDRPNLSPFTSKGRP